MFAKAERFFISEEREEITLEDRLYFYGFYIAIGVIALCLIAKGAGV